MAKLGYFFIAFPYLFATPFFLGIQPWALMLCSLYLLFNLDKVRINNLNIFFLFFSLLIFCLSIFMISYLSPGFIISILCPIIFILFYKITYKELTLNFLNIVLTIYFIFAFIYLLDPKLFESIHNLLLSQYRIDGGLQRGTGAAFFAPEPGLGAGILSMITLAWLSRLPEKKSLLDLARFLLICLCILLSKSGTGYLFFLMIVSYYVFSLSGSKLAARFLSIFLVIIFTSIIYFLYSYGFFDNNHGFKVLNIIISGDIPETSSVGVRISSIFTAYNELKLYGFGTIERMMYGLEDIINLNPGFPTNIARMVYAFGYLGILYYFILYINLPTSFQLRIFAIFSLIILFPISTPSIIFFIDRHIRK